LGDVVKRTNDMDIVFVYKITNFKIQIPNNFSNRENSNDPKRKTAESKKQTERFLM